MSLGWKGMSVVFMFCHCTAILVHIQNCSNMAATSFSFESSYLLLFGRFVNWITCIHFFPASSLVLTLKVCWESLVLSKPTKNFQSFGKLSDPLKGKGQFHKTLKTRVNLFFILKKAFDYCLIKYLKKANFKQYVSIHIKRSRLWWANHKIVKFVLYC